MADDWPFLMDDEEVSITFYTFRQQDIRITTVVFEHDDVLACYDFAENYELGH